MTLEFEKLTSAVADMVRQAGQRRRRQQVHLEDARTLLQTYAEAWTEIEAALDYAVEVADEKFYRSARPLHRVTPLNRGVRPPVCPQQATLIAGDGSQIVPDRHAPFVYYLINIGIMIYHHGSGRSPEIFTHPTLKYPQGEIIDEEDDEFQVSQALVGLLRDRAEIETLANTAWDMREGVQPMLVIVDQRLLYWPVGSFTGDEGRQVVLAWQEAMNKVRDSGGWLAGFIDRPGKRSVLTMLHSMRVGQRDFDISALYGRGSFAGLTDADLFDTVLQPGERSAVFVDISQHNNSFRDKYAHNEICFFYLKTGSGEGQIARVDIPMWVAEDRDAVATVHALLHDQCQILGRYPYIIARADEVAVVGQRDQEELENRIALQLQAAGFPVEETAKLQTKHLTRSGRTRHGGF